MTRKSWLIILNIALLAVLSAIIFLKSDYLEGKIREKIDSRLVRLPFSIKYTLGSFSFFPPALTLDTIEIDKNNNHLLSLSKCRITGVSEENPDIKIKCKSGALLVKNNIRFIKDMLKDEKSEAKKGGALKPMNISASIDDLALLEDKKSFSFSFDGSFSGGNIHAALKDRKDGATTTFIDANASLADKKISLNLSNLRIEEVIEMIKNDPQGNLHGSVSGLTEIMLENKTRAITKSDITITDFEVSHKLLDEDPLKLPFVRLEGGISANIARKELEFEKLSVSLGGIKAEANGTLSREHIKMSLDTEKMPFDYLATVFNDSTVFKDFRMDGTIQVKFKVDYEPENSQKEPEVELTGDIEGIKQFSNRFDYLKEEFEYDFTDKKGENYRFFIGPRNPDFTSIEIVPDFVQRAILLCEDGGFHNHKGLDFPNIAKALKSNLIKKGGLRGGSTIIQQLAKNLFLSREKNLIRKAKEALLAMELDASLSKDRLLEIYLNIVEWGPGIFGIGPAARHYFGKAVYELEPQEAVYLASIIPNPQRYYYQFTRNSVGEQWREFIDHVLELLYTQEFITSSEYIQAIKTPIKFNTETEPKETQY